MKSMSKLMLFCHCIEVLREVPGLPTCLVPGDQPPMAAILALLVEVPDLGSELHPSYTFVILLYYIVHDAVIKWKHFPALVTLCEGSPSHRLFSLTVVSVTELWSSLCLWMFWPHEGQTIHRHTAAHRDCFVKAFSIHSVQHSSPSENHCSVYLYFILMKLSWLRQWMSWPCKVPGLPQTRCCTPSWILFIGVLVSTYAQIINVFSYFTLMIMVLIVPVKGLAPRGLSHPQALSSSPAFVLSRLQYTQYVDIHFNFCVLYVNMIFTVSVDVLAQ